MPSGAHAPLRVDEVEALERVVTLDGAVHVDAALPAGMTLDQGTRVDHGELVAILDDLDVVVRGDRNDGKGRASGFRHFVQPQAWLWATSPLIFTFTGRSAQAQTRVPPASCPGRP